MNEETSIQFPQFPPNTQQPAPPNPTGLRHAHPKEYSPLAKMMKSLMKPKVKRAFKAPKHRDWKKKLSYY